MAVECSCHLATLQERFTLRHIENPDFFSTSSFQVHTALLIFYNLILFRLTVIFYKFFLPWLWKKNLGCLIWRSNLLCSQGQRRFMARRGPSNYEVKLTVTSSEWGRRKRSLDGTVWWVRRKRCLDGTIWWFITKWFKVHLINVVSQASL